MKWEHIDNINIPKTLRISCLIMTEQKSGKYNSIGRQAVLCAANVDSGWTDHFLPLISECFEGQRTNIHMYTHHP